MNRVPLTTTDRPRTEFGFARTKCDCHECAVSCRYVPGFLVPNDLSRLAPISDGYEAVCAWAREHLRASPGAKVGRFGPDGSVQMFRIHTLVPARHDDGSCHWLSAAGCAVHEDAPYGCAFADAHMPGEVGNQRSGAGLRAVAQAFADGELYAQLWYMLSGEGLVAVSPEEGRRRMQAAEGYQYPPNRPRP